DPDTAEIRVLRYCVVHDCGRLINPMIVEGQVHGGVAQGVGGALYERMAYDSDGQLQNASFMDFLMPYVSEVPAEIEIDHLETPSPLNPLGIKGAGEAGVIPSAAVFASAISDAEGFPIRSMPISPSERVWAALNDPAVLVRAIPGCQRLAATGPDAYEMTVTAGVASIKGSYAGTVQLTDLQPPNSFVLRAAGAGGPGTVSADVTVRLAERDGVTQLDYDADAVVGGVIGGVGQRMLIGVARNLAGEFFGNVDALLTGTAEAGTAETEALEAGPIEAGSVYTAPVA